MVQIGFNAQEYEPMSFGEPVKPDWYAMRISKIELKPNKAGDGSFFEMAFVFDENRHPELNGRQVWDRLNIHNKSEKAQNAARGQWRKIQDCVGRPACQDTDELLGATLLVKVVIQPATAEYEARNIIRDYRPIGDGAQVPVGSAAPHGAPVTSAAPSPAAPNAAPAQKPAWMRT